MAPTFHHSLGVGVDKLHVLGMYPYPLQPLALRGTMEELKKKKKGFKLHKAVTPRFHRYAE